jgi:hypothetical protein
VYCCKYDMYNFTFSRWQTLPAEPLNSISRIFTRVEWNIQITKTIYQKVYMINSIAKSYILNIKIRPLVTEYTYSWAEKNLRLVKLYLFGFPIFWYLMKVMQETWRVHYLISTCLLLVEANIYIDVYLSQQ